ncbi:hypothetical protein M3Y99_01065700 [Aphelenchoides fujianensis]|nr:hypothetical protein M3Y99_01065700 [Aphelenchoides fujianensis]
MAREDEAFSEFTPALTSGFGRQPPAESRGEIEPPPAYSSLTFEREQPAKKRSRLHTLIAANPVAFVVGSLILALTAGKILAVLLFSEEDTSNGTCDCSKGANGFPTEIRECWGRVGNLSKELVDRKQQNRSAVAQIARLEAEAVGLRAELTAAAHEADRLREEARGLRTNEPNGRRRSEDLSGNFAILLLLPLLRVILLLLPLNPLRVSST